MRARNGHIVSVSESIFLGSFPGFKTISLPRREEKKVFQFEAVCAGLSTAP